MLNDSKYKLLKKLSVLVVILYIPTIIVYFKWFYKPLKYIDNHYNNSMIIGVNKTIKSINFYNKLTFIIFSFFACILISVIIIRIFEEIQLYRQPVNEVYATLKLKKIEKRINAGSRLNPSPSEYFIYILNFEINNGIEFKFFVNTKQYFPILEGNKGILKFKEGRLNKFISFDLKEVE